MADTHASFGLGRGRIFFWASTLLLANTFVGDVLRYTSTFGLARALVDVFGVNVIIWLAVAAALSLLREELGLEEPATPLDMALLLGSLLAALMPSSSVSVAALTGLAVYIFLISPTGTSRRRAAAILMSVSVAIMWGRVLLSMFSGTLLRLDSVLVGLLGVRTAENQVYFAQDSGLMAPHFLIAPGCSSLHSISMVVVFATVVHGWFAIKPTAKSAVVCLIAIVAVVAINVMRLGAFAYFPARFDDIHQGWIASLIGWATIVCIVAIIGFGMKREILPNN